MNQGSPEPGQSGAAPVSDLFGEGDRVLAEIEARRELTGLLALESIGHEALGARIVGVGPEASADLYVSDGIKRTTIYFARLRDAMTARTLMQHIVSTVGAEPKLKDEDARHVVALMRRCGELEEAETDDQRAINWGRGFLDMAETWDVDMNDQRERWGALTALRKRDADGRPPVVVRCTDGTLYIRTGHFQVYAKTQDPTLSPARIAVMMQRVGWQRPGREGRIKATAPSMPGSIVQTFYIVPPTWDEMDGEPSEVTAGEASPQCPGEGVQAGEGLTRACAPVRELTTPAFTGSPDEERAA